MNKMKEKNNKYEKWLLRTTDQKLTNFEWKVVDRVLISVSANWDIDFHHRWYSTEVNNLPTRLRLDRMKGQVSIDPLMHLQSDQVAMARSICSVLLLLGSPVYHYHWRDLFRLVLHWATLHTSLLLEPFEIVLWIHHWWSPFWSRKHEGVVVSDLLCNMFDRNVPCCSRHR